MNARILRNAAFAALVALPALVPTGRADTFEQLTQTGFKEIEAANRQDAQSTPSFESAAAPSAETLGAFMNSSRTGQIFFCSASGCRKLRASGASIVVSSGKGGLYFTGLEGTGFCSSRRCDLLLPGVRATFPLEVGPNGDIWASSALAGYHCTPTACRQAYAGALEAATNFINGVYKANGDFVASGGEGTFWCSGEACRRVSAADVLFIEERCSGPVPARVSYGFFGRALWRCEQSGCREIGDAEAVDNFVSCSFDDLGRVHVPLRGASGSLACGDACVRDDRNVPSVTNVADPGLSMPGDVRGTDGFVYGFAGVDESVSKEVRTVVRRGGRAYAVNAACWHWFDGDEEDAMSPAWQNDCRLVP